MEPASDDEDEIDADSIIVALGPSSAAAATAGGYLRLLPAPGCAAPAAAAAPSSPPNPKEGQIKALKQALHDPVLFAERCKLWASLPHKRQETLRSHGALPVVIAGLRKHAGHALAVQCAARAMFELVKQEGDCTMDFPEVS